MMAPETPDHSTTDSDAAPALDSEAARQEVLDRVVARLQTRLDDGQPFVKSRTLAPELGYSAKRIGQVLAQIEHEDPRVTLTRRGGDSNGTTWQIEAGSVADGDSY